VVAVGDNDKGQCNVSSWRDIVAITAGVWNTVGLKSDGTVVAVGNNDNGQCNVSGWRDIVAITACDHTVGLKVDGTVVAVGKNGVGQCNVKDWRDIGPVSISKEKAQSLRWQAQGLCKYCGGKLGGLFTKKCKDCGREN